MDAPLSRLTGSTNAAAFWAVCRYDAVGNLTNIVYSGNHAMRLAYDNSGQLVSVYVTDVWESDFVYDGKMRLRERFESVWAGGTRVTNAVTLYVYDGNVVVQERNGGNLPAVTYTRGLDLSGTFQGAGLPGQSAAAAGGIGGLLARTDNSVLATQPSAAHAYYHADGNGNITCLINSQQSVVARYLYDPFGNTLSQSGPSAAANLYRFSSKEFHVNSGLVYYLYRFYDPNLQRWINRDPLGDVAAVNSIYRALEWIEPPGRIGSLGVVQPFERWIGPNPYRYVAGDPISVVDPLGLWTLGIGLSLNIQFGPISLNWNGGIVCDNKGHCGIYHTVGGGPGLGAKASGGLSFSASNAKTICDLGGPFSNLNLGGGAGLDAEANGWTGSSPNGRVVGGGFTLGGGLGAGGSAAGTYTWISSIGTW